MKSPQFGTLIYLEITKTIVGSSCGDSTSSIRRWLLPLVKELESERSRLVSSLLRVVVDIVNWRVCHYEYPVLPGIATIKSQDMETRIIDYRS